MSYVVINAIAVPPDHAATLEQRFAARAGAVESAPGFERFELLRPAAGTSDYLVYTRWASEADYRSWRDSQAFAEGHRGGSGTAMSAVLWEFDVV